MSCPHGREIDADCFWCFAERKELEFNSLIGERDNLRTYKAQWDRLMSKIIGECPSALNSSHDPVESILNALRSQADGGAEHG